MDQTIYTLGRGMNDDILNYAREAFCDSIQLKMQQFYKVVPKGSNPALTGAFVEELVRGFVKDWLSPSHLTHGTLYPHDCNNQMPSGENRPRQIDGIVFDPRLGPAIIREGGFMVMHPRLCQGVIEIKTSYPDMPDLERHLQTLYSQYLFPQGFNHMTWAAMGSSSRTATPSGTAGSRAWPTRSSTIGSRATARSSCCSGSGPASTNRTTPQWTP